MKKKSNKNIKKIFCLTLMFLFLFPTVVFAEDPSWVDKALSGLSNAAGNTTRSIFISIDSGIYRLIENVFGLFFDVANANFLVGGIYAAIFKRIFLILGVFMLFKLIFSFLTYIISPDTMSDPKNPGNAGKIIGRVITVLLFLIVLVPTGGNSNFNYNSNSKFDENVREQGILFGTLQSVQDAILDDKILSKIILGTELSDQSMQDTGNKTSLTIFSAFYKIKTDSLTESPTSKSYICENEPGISFSDLEEAESYRSGDWDEIKKFVNKTCKSEPDSYLFEYDLFVSTIVGLITVVIVFFFTFDAALRSIKLGILRLLSPIPAISYISPKSAKDGAFANYTKLLMNTYLDLFLRIAIIYIVILLISALTGGNSDLIDIKPGSSGLTQVIIIIALLFFAAQAPNFIMQALGIKSKGTGLGFGASIFGGALAGGVSGLAAGGLWGGVQGLFGGAKAGASHQFAAQAGQQPKGPLMETARNRAAAIATGDMNAKGSGIGSLLGSSIGNRVMGITPGKHGTVEAAKQYMYAMKNRQAYAQSDFMQNTGNLYGNRPDGTSWTDYANSLRDEVLDKQANVSKFKNWQRNLQNSLTDPNLDPNQRRAITQRIVNLDQDIATAEAELTAAQQAQQAGYVEYGEFITKEAGSAESWYQAGDTRLKKNNPNYRRGKERFRGENRYPDRRK